MLEEEEEKKRVSCFRFEENVEYTRKHFTFKGEERLKFLMFVTI